VLTNSQGCAHAQSESCGAVGGIYASSDMAESAPPDSTSAIMHTKVSVSSPMRQAGTQKSLLTCDFKSKWVLLVSFWISLSCSHTGTSKCMFAHFSEREVRSLSTPKLAIIISTPTLAFVLLWRDFSHDE